MLTHHLLELVCRIRIKSCHRLVEYPYRWIVHKCSYDHHFLTHTVGIADHLSVQAVLHAKALSHLLYPLLSLCGRHPIYISDEIDILKSRKSEKYIRIVGYITHRLLGLHRLFSHVETIYLYSALCRHKYTCQHLDGCCLTRTILSNKSYYLTLVYMEAEIIN